MALRDGSMRSSTPTGSEDRDWPLCDAQLVLWESRHYGRVRV